MPRRPQTSIAATHDGRRIYRCVACGNGTGADAEDMDFLTRRGHVKGVDEPYKHRIVSPKPAIDENAISAIVLVGVVDGRHRPIDGCSRSGETDVNKAVIVITMIGRLFEVWGLKDPGAMLAHLGGRDGKCDTACGVDFRESDSAEPFFEGVAEGIRAIGKRSRPAPNVWDDIGAGGEGTRENFGAMRDIQVRNFGKRDTGGEGTGDDPASAGSNDQVECGADVERLDTTPCGECAGDPIEISRGVGSAHASAVEAKHAQRSLFSLMYAIPLIEILVK